MLYKSEYWVQYETDETPQLRHTDIYECSSDRSMKRYISIREKFYPEFSTSWLEVEDAPNFDYQIWMRAIKRDTLLGWDNTEKKRFVIVKKAVTAKAIEQLEKECDNIPHRAYSDY